ncbi:MAG: class I SAM-dependent methyltransferase [Thermoguttaceae bacterium]|jgi:2-polyprenyl-3-methyl-5-hydroxy-6-metoxy-1,4-benzoquinol methylase
MPEIKWPDWYCPMHLQPLSKQDDALFCSQGCCYATHVGIPRFVECDEYAHSFGLQWKRYRQVQLDSFTGVTVSTDRLRHVLGEDLWNRLKGSLVLEAGCGAGRFTEVLLKQNANVVSVDLTEAVEANQENCPQGENHRLAQADILQLPLARRQFDLVLCIGVIQHTPSPEKTIAALSEHVKEGGWLVIDHYGYSLSHYTKTALLFRAVLRRMHSQHALWCTELLVKIFFPFHRMAKNFYPLQALVSRISPVLCYFHDLPSLSDEQHREWALLDTYDSLTDWYKHFRTCNQVCRCLKEEALTDIWIKKVGTRVEARAHRPLTSNINGNE